MNSEYNDIINLQSYRHQTGTDESAYQVFRNTYNNRVKFKARTHYAEEFENVTMAGNFGFQAECAENSVTESHYLRDTIVTQKLRFKNVFGPHKNEKIVFNPSGLKGVWKMLWFPDGFGLTVGLATEIKVSFQILSA